MLDELVNEYEKMFPGKDLYGELIDDLGMDGYKELLSRAMAEGKFMYVKSGINVLDGGEVVLLSSDSEVKKLNKATINRNEKDLEPGDTIEKVLLPTK